MRRSPRRASLPSILAVVALLAPTGIAHANGVYSHIHMSQLAVRELPPGELRDFFDDPENYLAAERGSMLPDSGYAAGDDYGEFAHWARFRMAYIDWIRATYADALDSPEAQRHMAFLMGAASHGISDQSYDILLLERGFEVDGEDPDVTADQYADYFIVIDDDVVFTVEPDAPYDVLSQILTDASGREVTQAVIMDGMDTIGRLTHVQSDVRFAQALYWRAWQSYPFLGTHIYNPEAAGSLTHMAVVIAEHWQVLWKRLHGTDDPDTDLVIHTFPEDGGVNWPVSVEESRAYGRVGIWFGYPFDRNVVGPMVRMRTVDGDPVEVTHHAAYGGRERSFLRLEPTSPLAYNTEYVVEVPAGFETLDGRVSTVPYTFSFRTQCAPDDLDSCPPYEPLVTGPVPMRGGGGTDAGPGDDAGTDAGTDAGGADAGADAGLPPAGGGSGGCAIGGAGGGAGLGLLGALAAATLGRRRRRRA